MKSNKFIKKCGPYRVTSHSQGGGVVEMIVYPAFPEYDLSAKQAENDSVDQSWKDEPHWANHRAVGDGGGPSIFTAIACANELSEFLNQSYQSRVVKEWQSRIKKIITDKTKDDVFKSCKTCCHVMSVPKAWLYCPECGGKLVKE